MLITLALGPALLSWLDIPQLYLPLLSVDVIAAGLQVALLGLLNVLFYLDKRRDILVLTLFFAVANVVLTLLSLEWGAATYGYGFALALLATVVGAMWVLDRRLEVLEFDTFMLQR